MGNGRAVIPPIVVCLTKALKNELRKGSPARKIYDEDLLVVKFVGTSDDDRDAVYERWYHCGHGHLSKLTFTFMPLDLKCVGWSDTTLLLKSQREKRTPTNSFKLFQFWETSGIFWRLELFPVDVQCELPLTSFHPGEFIPVGIEQAIAPIDFWPPKEGPKRSLPVRYKRKKKALVAPLEAPPVPPEVPPLVAAVLDLEGSQDEGSESGGSRGDGGAGGSSSGIERGCGGDGITTDIVTSLGFEGGSEASGEDGSVEAGDGGDTTGGDTGADVPEPPRPSDRRAPFPKMVHSEWPGASADKPRYSYLRLSQAYGVGWKDMRAVCAKHTECTWSISCRRSRPIGALWAWLNFSLLDECDSKEAHKMYVPLFATREWARTDVEELGVETDDWFEAEFGERADVENRRFLSHNNLDVVKFRTASRLWQFAML